MRSFNLDSPSFFLLKKELSSNPFLVVYMQRPGGHLVFLHKELSATFPLTASTLASSCGESLESSILHQNWKEYILAPRGDLWRLQLRRLMIRMGPHLNPRQKIFCVVLGNLLHCMWCLVNSRGTGAA